MFTKATKLHTLRFTHNHNPITITTTGTALNIKANELYLALKRKTDKDENSNEAIFGQILVAVCDFDVFMQMMR
jgi:hypothetical protein